MHNATAMRARTTTMARLCLLATLSLSHALQAQTRHRTSPLQARTTALRAQADGPVVALTREQGKNGGLAAALEGVASVEIPAVAQTRTADMEAALDAALLFVDEAWDWVVITSPEAARTFGDAAARSGVSMMRDARWRGVRLAAVGAATADALRARETGGWRDVHAPAKATAKSLAASLPRNESRPYENVLYPASALAARTLEDGLADRGFRVKRVDSYTTEPAVWTADDAARAAAAAVVAIGSPSAARVWAERVGTGQAVACIGETSARACEDLGFSAVFFPDKPGIPGWAASVRDAVASLGAE